MPTIGYEKRPLTRLYLCAGQPATTSFIPPSVDSIILDYQSPNAQPGFYPNEDPNSGGIGERPLTCMHRLVIATALQGITASTV